MSYDAWLQLCSTSPMHASAADWQVQDCKQQLSMLADPDAAGHDKVPVSVECSWCCCPW